MATIAWTEAEQRAVVNEGRLLKMSGRAPTTLPALFYAAQRGLPKARRKELTKAPPWFSSGIRAALPEVQPEREAAAHSEAADAEQAKKVKVFWRRDEKQALCKEAARLLSRLEAGGPRDALTKAQQVLPPERRRVVDTMAKFADWFPDGLMAASIALRAELDAPAAATATATANTVAPSEPPSEPPAEAPEPATPESAPGLAVDVTEPQPVQRVVPEPVTPVAAVSPVTSALAPLWAQIRERLVQEVADVVTEGILRSLQHLRLQPQQTEVAEATAPRGHVPFVHEPRKARPPAVLVVGLKGTQVSEIEADFAGKLDLRFCGADKSKDQLRAMTEQAETTVAFVDFLSHSHTDIIKARAKHYIETRGGITTLRQQLARLAGIPTNGTAHA